MKTVGIRELKDRLSEYLRLVRRGDSVLITDRGEVVAELAPPSAGAIDRSLPPGVMALVRRGLATAPSSGTPEPYPPLPRKRPRRWTAKQLLDAERGDR